MNKHNIIEIHDYKEDKEKVRQEQLCFEFLDRLKDKVDTSKSYAVSFKQHIEQMLMYGSITQSFADNLTKQVELIVKIALAEIELNK